MSGSWFLALSLIGALLVLNAARPLRGPISIMPSWLGVFLTTDLAPHHLFWSVVTAAAFTWGGALDTRQGQIALAILVVSWIVLLILWLPALKAGPLARQVAGEAGLDEAGSVPGALLFKPFARRREGVEIERDIEFFRVAGRSLKLDVFRPSGDHTDEGGKGRPALIYLHGGGWILGDKKDQGLPLCQQMASLGWICFNANYRLSPGATWPAHLVDANAAIAWVREHAVDYGVDPGFIALAGGSAGAHIAAMTALTTGDIAMQPGFESADTRVQAVATSYGVYDLTNRTGAHNPEFLTKMIGPLVIKAFPDEEPERFSAASPIEHVTPSAPPWLVLHGDNDTLAPVVESREFVNSLQETSEQAVVYLELPKAAHAFDVYYCHRATAAVDLTVRFLLTARRSA